MAQSEFEFKEPRRTIGLTVRGLLAASQIGCSTAATVTDVPPAVMKSHEPTTLVDDRLNFNFTNSISESLRSSGLRTWYIPETTEFDLRDSASSATCYRKFRQMWKDPEFVRQATFEQRIDELERRLHELSSLVHLQGGADGEGDINSTEHFARMKSIAEHQPLTMPPTTLAHRGPRLAEIQVDIGND